MDSLSTAGKLIIGNNDSLSIKFQILPHHSTKIDNINWDSCETVKSGTTFRPKESCTIVLYAVPIKKSSNTYCLQTFDFNMATFVEILLQSQNNISVINQWFAYSKNKPLTIEYDNTIEDVCSNNADKGFLDNLRQSIINGDFSIDSISCYNTYFYKQKLEELVSEQYPTIQYIGCKSK